MGSAARCHSRSRSLTQTEKIKPGESVRLVGSHWQPAAVAGRLHDRCESGSTRARAGRADPNHEHAEHGAAQRGCRAAR